MSNGPGRREIVAAEYVLGLLDPARRREIENLMARDAAWRDAVAAWQSDLEPLARTVPPSAPPPELWERIEATLGKTAPGSHSPTSPLPRETSVGEMAVRLRRRLARWRAAALAAGALAACAVLLLWRVSAEQPVALAVMQPQGILSDPLPVVVTVAGMIEMRPRLPIHLDAGHYLAVWAKPLQAHDPEFLGEVPPRGGSLSFAGLATNDTTVMITSETGPLGQDSAPGKTLYQGVLTTMLR